MTQTEQAVFDALEKWRKAKHILQITPGVKTRPLLEAVWIAEREVLKRYDIYVVLQALIEDGVRHEAATE